MVWEEGQLLSSGCPYSRVQSCTILCTWFSSSYWIHFYWNDKLLNQVTELCQTSSPSMSTPIPALSATRVPVAGAEEKFGIWNYKSVYQPVTIGSWSSDCTVEGLPGGSFFSLSWCPAHCACRLGWPVWCREVLNCHFYFFLVTMSLYLFSPEFGSISFICW